MKKVVFGITSLELGGAERVLVDLVNELSKNKKYEITVFTIYGKGKLEKQIASNIKINTIYNLQYKKLKFIQRKIIIPLQIFLLKNKIYKKYIKGKYDVEIAFLEGPITRIFSCSKNRENKIAWIHNDISQVFGSGIKSKIKSKVDQKIYNKFKEIIFVSKNNLESFKRVYPRNIISKQVIYNYIDSKKVLEEAEQFEPKEFKQQQINLLTVARLVEQKALDRFIKVHSKLIREGLNHNLYIIGEGPEKYKLQELIKFEKCENTVKLLGAKENPYPYMKKADYICLFSEYEGYGMVLEEAKILNKYILITNTAASEALKNYNKSKIFENSEEGIYIGLKKILNATKKLSTKQEKTINNNLTYDNYNILEQIEKLIN